MRRGGARQLIPLFFNWAMLCAAFPNRADAATSPARVIAGNVREISSLPTAALADCKDFFKNIRTILRVMRALTLLEQFKNRAEALHI